MPKLSLNVSHSIGQDEAVRRLKDRFSEVKNAYQQHVKESTETWDGNVLSFQFTAFGVSVQGQVAVEPSEVRVLAHLPLMAMIFKGTIEKQLREQLTMLLA